MFRKTFAVMLSGLLLVTAFGLQPPARRSRTISKPPKRLRSRCKKLAPALTPASKLSYAITRSLRVISTTRIRDSFTVVDSKTGRAKR